MKKGIWIFNGSAALINAVMSIYFENYDATLAWSGCAMCSVLIYKLIKIINDAN